MNTEEDSYATIAAPMAPTPVTTTTMVAESATIPSEGVPVEGNGVSKQSSKALERSQSPGRAGGRIGPPIVLSVRGQARSDVTSTTFARGAKSARAGSNATAKTTTEDTKDMSARSASGKSEIAQGSSNDQTTVKRTSSQTKAKGKEVPGRIVQASGQGSSSQTTTGSVPTGGQTSSGTTSAEEKAKVSQNSK